MTLQNKRLCATLVSSVHYMRMLPPFSWGDAEIANCSVGIREIRDPTTMIAVDSNHHVSAVVSEVFEHQRTVVPALTTGAIRAS